MQVLQLTSGDAELLSITINDTREIIPAARKIGICSFEELITP
jgi:hypothetical protein